MKKQNTKNKTTNVMGAALVLKSSNSKLGNVSATYASIDSSCPNSCSLKDNGCYAQLSFVGIHTAKLNAAKLDSKTVARQEAALIKKAIKEEKNLRPLRLHVAGDCRTVFAANTISAAVKDWIQPVWTYTHAWKDIPRSAWGNKISVLASVEKIQDIKSSFRKGYAPAIILSKFPNGKKAFKLDQYKIIPCPNQTHENIDCEKCKLCWNDKKLKRMKSVIAFEAHGTKKNSLPITK